MKRKCYQDPYFPTKELLKSSGLITSCKGQLPGFVHPQLQVECIYPLLRVCIQWGFLGIS